MSGHQKANNAYTLVEILVVVLVFSILGLVITRVVTTTLRSSGKSENTVILRENINYAMGVMERNIRNAEEIVRCQPLKLDYKNSLGSEENYECAVSGGIGRITSSELGGQFLTNSEVSVDCTVGTTVFSCPTSDVVDIIISAIDAQSASTSENALTTNYSESIRVKLRNY